MSVSSTTKLTKLKGYEFFKQSLNSAKYVVAPMVDQSELAWRELTRKHGAQLCYTPMYHAKLFGDSNSSKYRDEMFQTLPEDRPLIVQFCANDPIQLFNAAKLVEDKCDAVDINLGCPQHIAKRGHYGSYLQDEWPLIESMVRKLDTELNIPVTCKIRIFPEVEKTLAYAKMLENAGCQLLTVHGRLREQKGHNTGLADWEQIKMVKEALSIPVYANGNILYFEDIEKCIKATGVDGVMSAEAVLYNPTLFSGEYLPLWELSKQYFEICKRVKDPRNVAYTRAHLFKMYKSPLSIYTDLRAKLGQSRTFEQFEEVILELDEKLKADAEGKKMEEFPIGEDGLKVIPHWLAQPYIRPPNVHNQLKAKQPKETEDSNQIEKRPIDPETSIGDKVSVKQQRVSTKLICKTCSNVASAACHYLACKLCCKDRLKNELEAHNTDKSTCQVHDKAAQAN